MQQTIITYPDGHTLRFPNGYTVFGESIPLGELDTNVWHLAYIDTPRPQNDPLRQIAAFEWTADTENLEYRKEWIVNDRSPEAIAATLNTEAESVREAARQKLAAAEWETKYLANLKTIASLPDAEATARAPQFEPFLIGKAYALGERFFNPRDGRLYRVAQAHTSAVQWLPHENPALYVAILPPGEIGPWKQPAGAHDAYQLNAQVIHQESTWENTTADNVWEPGIFGWTKIA